jgi:GNAT superfamily N-acetyltransferase
MPNDDLKTEQRNEKGGVRVRPAETADRPGMKRVWHDVFGSQLFGGECTYDRHLVWAYESNPDCHPESVTHWVAEVDNDIVAAWSTMPVGLLIHGELHQSYWLQNCAVASRAQRLGIGRRMFRSIIASNQLTLGVGVTSAARRLYESEGVPWVPADRFIFLQLSAHKAARSFIGDIYHRRFHNAWAVVHSSTLRCIFKLRTPRPAVQIMAIDRFGRELDDFISRLASVVPVMTHRSSAKLNWIIENPRIQTVAFTASRAGEFCGYVILRRDGVLLDFLVHPDDTAAFTGILARVLEWAKHNKISQISGIRPAFPPLGAMYDKCGFVSNQNLGFGLFYVCAENRRRNPILSDPVNWYLSMADSDLCSFLLKE